MWAVFIFARGFWKLTDQGRKPLMTDQELEAIFGKYADEIIMSVWAVAFLVLGIVLKKSSLPGISTSNPRQKDVECQA